MNKFTIYCTKNEIANLIWQKFDDSKGNSKEVDLKSVENWLEGEGILAERTELVRVVREMERLGVIKFIVGRRGAASRILWLIKPEDMQEETEATFKSIEVASNVFTPLVESVEQIVETVPESIPIDNSTSTAPGVSRINLTVRLESGGIASLSFPKEPTDADIKRMIDAINMARYVSID